MLLTLLIKALSRGLQFFLAAEKGALLQHLVVSHINKKEI
jgi:hypothetical protein